VESENTTNRDIESYLQAQQQFRRLIAEGNSFSGNERNCVFLNTGGPGRPEFANISAVSGFDFLDDGRAMATTDWDFDGDIDFWISNRTGPRLRFLRNEIDSGNRFIFVRLTGNGASSNRDAIGSRVELDVGDDTLVRTLKAGEGFISQASKWIHFGLGKSGEVGRVRVRWPDGTEESFKGLVPNHYYTIGQGDESLNVWTPPNRQLALKPGAIKPPRPAKEIRVVLPAGVPLPRLKYKSFDGTHHEVSESLKNPLLLNLWASWCGPCVTELKQFQEQDLNVVALSVEGVTSGAADTGEDARKLFSDNGLNLRCGFADAHLLGLLQTYNNAMLEDHRPMPVPTSMLIDVDGSVAVIYKGTVEPTVVKADIDQLSRASDRFREQAQPFRGRWLIPPSPASPMNFVNQLLAQHMLDEALAYIDEFVTTPDPALANALIQLVQQARDDGRYDLMKQVDMLARKKLGRQLPPQLLHKPAAP
jgi:thiol-disulfide isomerase/thioredoxin